MAKELAQGTIKADNIGEMTEIVAKLTCQGVIFSVEKDGGDRGEIRITGA